MKKAGRNIGIYIVLFVVVIMMVLMFTRGAQSPQDTAEEVTLTQFTQQLSEKNIKTLTVDMNKMYMLGELKDGKLIKSVYSTYDYLLLDEKYILPQMEAGTLKMSTEAPKSTPWYISMLPTLIMVLLLVFFWIMIMNQQGGGGKAMSFGRSKAKMNKDNQRKITFKDVAGLKEEKEELEEVVDFLKHPKRYQALGARIPKGILLVGPPGTGKTYVSRAAAGEAGVPFFTISGSEFVEMFVGVGASRVRDLFDQAKKNAPCIVFIDEIDAVGRKRGAGLGGGNDEREQTLNQLLVEMDGFQENSGIIILAATNRPDVLDPALLRPGRFDRQIVIGVPDVAGREEIFKVHSRNKSLAPDVNPEVLARSTPGFTPADIENMMNEAALLTARRNGKAIRMDEIEEAITKVIAGPQKKSRVISEKERKLTAFHEAGHAIVANALPNTDPVHQITIVPRGRAGGFTMILPKEDRSYATKGSMREQIIHLLGGRVAEALTLDDISTGASNDIQRATDIARDMVTKYGFSEKLGPVNYSSGDEVFLGKDFSKTQNFSDEVAANIDAEIRAIIEECYEECEKILKENMDKLTLVASALLKLETLDGEQFLRLVNGEVTDEELAVEQKERFDKIQEANESEAAEMREKANREAQKEAAERQRRKEEFEKRRNGKILLSDLVEIPDFMKVDDDFGKKKPEETSEAADDEADDTENIEGETTSNEKSIPRIDEGEFEEEYEEAEDEEVEEIEEVEEVEGETKETEIGESEKDKEEK